MYIKIRNGIFRTIRGLSFAPRVDVIGNGLPINEFSAEIVTDAVISIGNYAYLYDNDGELWAKYWVVEAQKLSPSAVTVRCQSDIMILDRKTLPARMCDGNGVSGLSLIRECFSTFGLEFSFSAKLLDKQIVGYLPEQTARERLQWICFTMGAFVKDCFGDMVKILPLPTETKHIQNNKVFYRPKIKYDDYVTAVSATAYAYTAGQPSTVDKWVSPDDEHYYIQTSTTAALQNTDAPENAPDNVIALDKMTIINADNISDILSRLSAEYFNRESLTADVLNDGTIQPGDRVSVFDGVENVISGYIQSASFVFGKAAKSAIVLTQTVSEKAVTVIVAYTYGGYVIARETYLFPRNTDYVLQSVYVDDTAQGIRRIYRPLKGSVSGNTGDKEITTAEVKCEIALEYEDNNLSIYSVDGLDGDEVVSIA